MDLQFILSQITSKDLAAYRDYLSWQKRLSPASIERKFAVMRRFFQFLQSEALVETTPFRTQTAVNETSAFQPFSPHPTHSAPGIANLLQTPATVTEIIEDKYREFKNELVHLPEKPEKVMPSGRLENFFYRIGFHTVKLYKSYHKISLSHYLHFGILVVVTSFIAILGYNRWFAQPDNPQVLSAQVSEEAWQPLTVGGKLTDNSNLPVTTAKSMRFRLFPDRETTVNLYDSGPCSITLKEDGTFSARLGSDCGDHIAKQIFTQNSRLYLGIQVDGEEEMKPRQPIATVSYAANAETLAGHLPATSATEGNIPVIDKEGKLVIAAKSPEIIASSGNLRLSGQNLILATNPGTGGDITLAPDIGGTVNLIFGSNNGNLIAANAANLESGTLYSGSVPNQNTGYYFLRFQAGPTLTDRFRVDAMGNMLAGETLTLAGISPTIAATDGMSLNLGNSATAAVLVASPLRLGAPVTPLVSETVDLGTSEREWRNIYTHDLNQSGNLLVGGMIGVGTHSPTQKLDVAGQIRVGTFAGASDSTVCQNNNVLSTCTSSRLFKDHIQSLSDHDLETLYGEIINDMKLTNFTYKNDKTGQEHYGLIAEDAPKRLQVTDNSTGTPFTNLDFYSQWAYSFAGIKMLHKNLETLGNKLTSLAATVSQLQPARDNSGESQAGEFIITPLATSPSDQSGPQPQETAHFSLVDRLGNTISRWGVFSEATIAKLEVGVLLSSHVVTDYLAAGAGVFDRLTSKLIEVGNLTAGQIKTTALAVTDRITATTIDVGDSLSAKVLQTRDLVATGSSHLAQLETEVIRPIPNEDVVIDLEKTTEATSSSRLLVQGNDSQIVASIDASGNASLSGQIRAESAHFDHDATISGELHANELVTSHGRLNDILGRLENRFASATQSAQYITNVYNTYQSTINPTPTPLPISASAALAPESPATSSGQLEASVSALLAQVKNWSLPLSIDDLTLDTEKASSSASLSGQELVAPEGLAVLGQTSLSETFIHGQLLVNGVAINDSTIESFQKTLEIQKTPAFPVKIMAGLVTIDTSGNLKIAGDVNVAGKVVAPVVVATKLASQEANLGALTVNQDATVSGSLQAESIATDRLTLTADPLASAASFLTPDQVSSATGILSPGIATKTTSGSSFLPAGTKSLVVFNPNLSAGSLIYLTPQSPTGNNVLYVAQKKWTEPTAADHVGSTTPLTLVKDNSPGYFTVAIDHAYNDDIRFNWFIVNGHK